jgi:hypothetical protein
MKIENRKAVFNMNNEFDDTVLKAQKIVGVEISDRAREVLGDKEKMKRVLSQLTPDDMAMLSALVSGKAQGVDIKTLEHIKSLIGE